MLINLLPYTRRYPLADSSSLVVDGIVQTSVCMHRLIDITPKIYDFEDLSIAEGPITKLYTSALEIARDTKDLAS